MATDRNRLSVRQVMNKVFDEVKDGFLSLLKDGAGNDLTSTDEGGGRRSLDANLTRMTVPVIYNVTCTLKDTEYSQALPANTKGFAIKGRPNNASLRVAFVVNESGTNYITVPEGSVASDDKLNLAAVTLYFQADKDAAVVEIIAWT